MNEEEATTLREMLELLADVPVRFWQCPVEEHAERKGEVTVRWDGDTAHCTADGCPRTSKDGGR